METARLIAYLNAIDVGAMHDISAKLQTARQACAEIGQGDLADKLAEAESALHRADLKTYRKRIETVVARLGHLK